MNHGRYNDRVFETLQMLALLSSPIAIMVLISVGVSDNSAWWSTVLFGWIFAIVNLIIWEK